MVLQRVLFFINDKWYFTNKWFVVFSNLRDIILLNYFIYYLNLVFNVFGSDFEINDFFEVLILYN